MDYFLEPHASSKCARSPQGREATREAVGGKLDASVETAFKTAQRQAELRDAKRQEALDKAAERRMTFQQRVRGRLASSCRPLHEGGNECPCFMTMIHGGWCIRMDTHLRALMQRPLWRLKAGLHAWHLHCIRYNDHLSVA
jgi:hypothetical protein